MKSIKNNLNEWKSLQSEWKLLQKEWKLLQKSEFYVLGELTEGQLFCFELSLCECLPPPPPVKFTLLESFSLFLESFSLVLKDFHSVKSGFYAFHSFEE